MVRNVIKYDGKMVNSKIRCEESIMDKNLNTYLVTFKTHFGAMRYKKACAMAGIEATLMAVPRELSTSCGNCLTFQAEAVPAFDEGQVFLVIDGKYVNVKE